MLDKFRRHIDAIEPSFKSRPPCTYKLFEEQSETRKLFKSEIQQETLRTILRCGGSK